MNRRQFLQTTAKATAAITTLGITTSCQTTRLHQPKQELLYNTLQEKQPHSRQQDIGISLEGGAAMTARQVGIITILKKTYGIQPGLVSGNSAAALNAVYYAANQIKDMEDIWSHEVTKPGFAGIRRHLRGEGYFDNDRLIQTVMNRLNTKALKTSKTTLYIPVLDVDDGTIHWLQNDTKHLQQALRANVAEPISDQTIQIVNGFRSSDSMYGEPLPHSHPAMKQKDMIYIPTSPLDLNQSFLDRVKRRIRKALTKTHSHVHKQLVDDIMDRRQEQYQYAKRHGAAVLAPTKRYSRTNTSYTTIRSSVLSGALEALTNKNLHELFETRPEQSLIDKVEAMHNSIQ